ncbi:Uncharacterised protein [Chlamydia trachomatis]|nr:Uncharacterised protein [Chlamydia trachomatis]
MTLSYVSNNRSKLFLLSAENQIILIHTNNWTVRRNWKNAKLVCSHKLGSFRFCSTSHASKLVVHAEVILQSNSCKSLIFCFYFNILFSFNRLMQAFAITTTWKNTASVLVNNQNFAISNNIIAIKKEQFLSFQSIVQVANQSSVAWLVKIINT